MHRGAFKTAALACLLVVAARAADLTSPEKHFGHAMGADRKLVEWPKVASYYRLLAQQSDYLRIETLGKSTEGRDFLLVTVAAPETLERLDRYQQIQKSLADPRKTSAAAAEDLIAEGKAVVLITCSIHSSEVASTMTAMEYVYRLLSEETKRNRAILENTIFLLVPSLNPDGVDKVAAWYKRWLGTPHEGAPMTELYHKYLGHDNNRDWYIFSQEETRLTVEKIHNVWHPEIVYDVHQMGTTGARIFVPPWIDPIDENIDPIIVQQANSFGAAMAADLTAAGKKGVVIHGIYDYFTPARHYQSYHGGVRLLSESAGVRMATPITVPFSSLQTRARGYNSQKRSWNFLEPWRGGKWTLRNIVENQLTTFESVLYSAALRREDLLRNFYRIGARALEPSGPSAFVVPREQHDPNAAQRLLETLSFGLVEIGAARSDFEAGGQRFAEGDRVVSLTQPYRSFAKTLLERQRYPNSLEYPGGPPKSPYDVTSHSLPLLMGVKVVPVNNPLDVALAPVESLKPASRVDNATLLSLSPSLSHSFRAVSRLLKLGRAVYRDERSGDFLIEADADSRTMLEELAEELGLELHASEQDTGEHRRLRTPRVGLYNGSVPIMDEGWTRWLLEQNEIPYKTLDNARIRRGNLTEDFDVVVLPDAPPRTLQSGWVEGALYNGVPMPSRYTGGIGQRGAGRLREFLNAGGTVLALNRAARYAIERLGAPVRNVLTGIDKQRFYSPGALWNAAVDLQHPLTFGMQSSTAVWFESGPVFAPAEDNSNVRTVVSYPARDVLASGWLLGEEYVAERAAVIDVSFGDGHLLLFGIRPQYRGQSYSAFKLFFNGLFYWKP